MTGVLPAVRARLRAPDALRANANALIASTAVTSAAGLGFWALAARWLPADAVGLGTALVSVLTLLANVATLGLRNGMVRFLPAAGHSTRRLIGGGYLACVTAAVVLSAGFLLGQPWWAGDLDFLRRDALTIGAFVLSTAVWVLFVLQDHILIGLRHSRWVPAKNLTYSLTKIAALPLLTGAAMWAVLGATVLPAVVIVLAVGVLVQRLTRVTGAGDGADGAPRMSVRQLVRFAASDQIAWLVWVATPHVLTLIVLHLRGPEASAYYYMANMIGYSLYLITSNIGSALIAESAHDPEQQSRHARTALVHSVRLVVPLAAVGILAGPFVLRILGADYAENASVAMQLIILSALPQIIVGISVNTARVRREMSTVVATYVFLAVAIWGGSWVTLQWWGVTGVGATILAAQSAAALGLTLSGRTGLGTPAQTVEAAWSEVARLSRAVRALRDRRDQRRLVPPALAALGVSGRPGPGDTADPPEVRTLKSDSDTLVAAVHTATGGFVLKIATSAAADRNLARHVDTVSALGRHNGSPCGELLPRVLDRTTVGGHTVVRETLLPGVSPAVGTGTVGGASAPGGTDAGAGAAVDTAPAAAAAIASLHTATSRSILVPETLLGDWVEAPAAAVRCLTTEDRHAAAVDGVARFLRDGLLGRQLTVSCTHGDYWPGNVLVENRAEGPVVTGIVDWENYMDPGLPDADLAHWYLATRRADLGAAVCAVLDDSAQLTRYYESIGTQPPNPHLEPEIVVLFTWLWHVANTRTRATRRGPGRIWYARSVTPVLRRFGPDPGPPDDPTRQRPAPQVTTDEVSHARHA